MKANEAIYLSVKSPGFSPIKNENVNIRGVYWALASLSIVLPAQTRYAVRVVRDVRRSKIM